MALTRAQAINQAETEASARANYEARRDAGILGTGMTWAESTAITGEFGPAGQKLIGTGVQLANPVVNPMENVLGYKSPGSNISVPGGIGGLIPGALGALGGLGGALGTIGAVGAGLYGILQGMGLGEGEGLFGLDLLGGDTQYVGGIPIGGPGLAEPGKDILIKEWHVQYDGFRLQYYLVNKPGTKRRYIMLYNTKTKVWKSWPWRTPHLAVIGKNMPSHKNLTRLRRNLKRHTDDAKTILKLVSPGSLATRSGGRPRRGAHKH